MDSKGSLWIPPELWGIPKVLKYLKNKDKQKEKPNNERCTLPVVNSDKPSR